MSWKILWVGLAGTLLLITSRITIETLGVIIVVVGLEVIAEIVITIVSLILLVQAAALRL
jgi:hypothetical protein